MLVAVVVNPVKKPSNNIAILIFFSIKMYGLFKTVYYNVVITKHWNVLMYYIGLMAGTSFDGVDASLINAQNKLISHHYTPYSATVRTQLLELVANKHSLADIAQLDQTLATIFSQTVLELLAKTSLKPSDITAIGSHGQTIYHAPKQYSWQIAHPSFIAQQTGIAVVADFRMADIAVGGEGAPLTPRYHQYLLQNKNGIVINLGGITNITIVQGGQVTGFDVGPANTLMDNWINQHQQKKYDHNGDWASSGNVLPDLLQVLLSDNYFAKASPKSTGFEYFNLTWLAQYLTNDESPADVQATLLALTTHSINQVLPKDLPIYLCGGGTNNTALVTQLSQLCSTKLQTTQALGMHPDFLEASAFAFFAKQTLNRQPSNLPSVTHAKSLQVLGGIYQPTPKL